MDEGPHEISLQTWQWMLTGYWEFLEPAAVLAGISPEDACRTVDALPYSIAKVLAHMDWWQQRRIAAARGEELQDYVLQVDDWPEVAPGEWEGLVTRFLEGLDSILALAQDGTTLKREVYGDRTAGAMLLSHTCHNAYHLGQIVLLRRLLGLWEPAAE